MAQFSSNPTLGDAPNPSVWKPVVIGVGVVMLVVVVIAVVWRSRPKHNVPDPYVANVKLSDIKMSAAQNFVGASVTYIDGTVTNTGGRIVTFALVDVTFRDDLGQVAEQEQVPLRVLQTAANYDNPVSLMSAPLAPGKTKPFRLTFEGVSVQWNHAYPELKIADVTVR